MDELQEGGQVGVQDGRRLVPAEADETFLERYGAGACADPDQLVADGTAEAWYSPVMEAMNRSHVRWATVRSVDPLIERVRAFVQRVKGGNDSVGEVLWCFDENYNGAPDGRIYFNYEPGMGSEVFNKSLDGLSLDIVKDFEGEICEELLNELNEIRYRLGMVVCLCDRSRAIRSYYQGDAIYKEHAVERDGGCFSASFFLNWFKVCKTGEQKKAVFEAMKASRTKADLPFLNEMIADSKDLDDVIFVLHMMVGLGVDPDSATLGSIVNAGVLEFGEYVRLKRDLSGMIEEFAGGGNMWGVTFYEQLVRFCGRRRSRKKVGK